MKYRLTAHYKKLLADTVTPVSIYLRIRDEYPNSILLESSDYHGSENSFSFICFNPIATIRIENETIIESLPDGETIAKRIEQRSTVEDALLQFAERFQINSEVDDNNAAGFAEAGMFGYTSYDAVRYFEDIDLKGPKNHDKSIPDIIYSVYRYFIAINHFNDEMTISELCTGETSSLDEIEQLICGNNFSTYHFSTTGKEQTNVSDEEFLCMVRKAKVHCRRGDIFQVVMSREFSQSFQGDEFNVYRALRSVNPSPYLFYFDYGSFKIFGSSPEAQLVIKNKTASIHPIAGTFRRTGDEENDTLLAQRLKADAKENAEHTMLVDLARNDLSKSCSDVRVESFRQIQYYSHVIHLVSKVSGEMNGEYNTFKIAADTFPAGTLSGAPKHRAMQLIDEYEKNNRGFYGGCIGFIGFRGSFNHAIIIRSFLSKNQMLFYQAGAGIVDASDETSELLEVNHKLAALKKAIELAQQI